MTTDSASYHSLRSVGRKTLRRRRSQFIGTASPASDERTARDLIEQVSSKVPDASHHAYAYRVGIETVLARYSDDGEPSGTAGMPLLQLLEGRELTNSIVVVSRIFGGTLLGTGGLARAYADAGRAAIEAAGTSQYVMHEIVQCEVPYPLWGKLEHSIQEAGHLQLDVQYGAQVTVMLAVARDQYSSFCAWVAEESSDSVHIDEVERRYLPWNQ